jgi:hypothetical protein
VSNNGWKSVEIKLGEDVRKDSLPPPLPMTLLNPQYFDFILDQKLQNVFTENFLVQIHQKFREIHSEVRI